MSDRYDIEAEEILFTQLDPVDLATRVITIDSNVSNINLRTLHDAIYPAPDISASPAETLTVIIDASVKVSSLTTATPALNVGSWPDGYPITIECYGRIEGAGGAGGNGFSGGENGLPGGTALYTRESINLHIHSAGGVWGGGGGGAGLRAGDLRLGGGGGAGIIAGAGGTGDTGNGSPGTSTAGGQGAEYHIHIDFVAGDGGAPGAAGTLANAGEGTIGAAGKSIDGISFVTLTNDNVSTGVRGPTAN